MYFYQHSCSSKESETKLIIIPEIEEYSGELLLISQIG